MTTFTRIAHLAVQSRSGADWVTMPRVTLGIKDGKWAMHQDAWPAFGRAVREAKNAFENKVKGTLPLPDMSYLEYFALGFAMKPETEEVAYSSFAQALEYEAFVMQELLKAERFIVEALKQNHLVQGTGATLYRVTLMLAIAGYVPATPENVWEYSTSTELRRLKAKLTG